METTFSMHCRYIFSYGATLYTVLSVCVSICVPVPPKFFSQILKSIQCTSSQDKRLRFCRLTILTNVRSTKVFLMVTIPRTVTIQLQPFLLCINLALKNFYRTGIWLSNIIIRHFSQAEHVRP